MAGYECSLCSGQEQASLLITPLTGGETMAVGQDCMAVGLAGMLAGHLGLDAEKLWDAVQRLANKQLAAAAKQASEDRAAMQAEGEGFPEGPSGSGSDDLAAIERAAAAAAGPAGESGPPVDGLQAASAAGPEGIPDGSDSPPAAPAGPAKGGQAQRLPGRPPRHAGRST